MSRQARMAAFDLGLALIFFVVVWILQSHASPNVTLPRWPLALVACLAMLIGGHFTSRFEPPTEHIARRFLRRALMPPLVGVLAVGVPSILVFSLGGGVGLLQLLAGMFLAGAFKVSLPALVVTALWALVYVVVERRIAAL